MDRVLYQAIYRVLYPVFDKTFIFDCYSSRNSKGTHAGIKRLNIFLRKLSKNYTAPVHVLKCDIRKFFDSIDHGILLEELRQKISCNQTLDLLKQVIDSFHKTQGKGLPLGNVTSQIFANIYMNSFDWHVKKELGFKYYVRYCDDFVILSPDKSFLIDNVRYIEHYLNDKLRLNLHQDKIFIRKLRQGIDFLGAVILPHRIVPRTKTRNRIIRKSKRLLQKLKDNQITKEKFSQSLSSYIGHLSHSKSKQVSTFLHSLKSLK